MGKAHQPSEAYLPEFILGVLEAVLFDPLESLQALHLILLLQALQFGLLPRLRIPLEPQPLQGLLVGAFLVEDQLLLALLPAGLGVVA